MSDRRMPLRGNLTRRRFLQGSAMAGVAVDGDGAGEMSVDLPVRRSLPKVGRNEPCPCGSGKKHKNCCGRTA